MSNNDADFSASAELALQVPESEKRRVEGEVSDIGPVMLSAGGQRGAQAGGAGSVQQSPTQLTELETVADLAEEQLRVDEIRNTLLRELLEDSGAALASGGGGGGGGGSGLPGGSILTRVGGTTGGTGLGLGLGSVGATTAGAAAAGIGIPGIALAGILDDDSNANPGDLQESPTDTNVTTPNAEVSRDLERLLSEGLGVNRPSWLSADGTIDVRQDLVEDTTAAGGETPEGSPGGSSAPTGDVGGPTGTAREDLVEDTAGEGQTPSGSRDGGSPGGSSPPVSDIGGPGANTSTGTGLVEAVLGDVGTTPDGSPGGSTPSRTGGLNEAAERRRQNAPNIDVEARVESDGISEREAERIAEEKAQEAAEDIENRIARRR
jgi:hypothetical protein